MKRVNIRANISETRARGGAPLPLAAAFCMVHSALCFVAATAGAATAGTVFNVADVVALTNALDSANANDCEIRIAPGTYDLSGVVMAAGASHLMIRKIGTTGRKIVGTGAGPADTVLLAGAGDGVRILDAHNAAVSNLTLTGASTTVNGGGVYFAANGGGLYDCIVSNNTSTVAGGGVHTSYATTIAGCLLANNSCTGASGGALAANKNVVVRDCVFRDNYAKSFGGAFDFGASFDRCEFIGNSAGGGGGVCRPTSSGTRTVFRDCVFIGNSAPKGGVAYYGADWQRCVFIDNHATAGNGGVTKSEGLSNIFTDCAFTNNYVLGGNSYSAFDSAAAATNCVFFGNYATTSGTGLIGSCASVEGCMIDCNTGMPLVVSCTLRNCRIKRNVSNRTNSNPLISACALYNCLVEGNASGAHNMSFILGTTSGGTPSRLFNCTVVSNGYYAVNYSVASGVAVNTIFSGNYIASSATAQDIKAAAAPAMTNCLYTALSGTLAEGAAPGCIQTASPGFRNAGAGDWRLTRKASARNAGWADAAYLQAVGPRDLEGNPRVFAADGAIDIGAFECSVFNPGTFLKVK